MPETVERGQGKLIRNLNTYFESQDLPFRMSSEGMCHGLSVLRCKYVLEGRENDYYKMLDQISNETLQGGDKSLNELNEFVMQVLKSHAPEVFSRQKQRDAFSMLEVPGEGILKFNMIASTDTWKKTMESLHLQKDEAMILSTPTHTMSVSVTADNKYRLADPNDHAGFQDFESSDALLDHITSKYVWKGDYGFSVEIVRNKESMSKTREPPLPTMQEIYKDINLTAATERMDGKFTQFYFVFGLGGYDDTETFNLLLNKVIDLEGDARAEALSAMDVGLVFGAAQCDSVNILTAAIEKLPNRINSNIELMVDKSIDGGAHRVFSLLAERPETQENFKKLFSNEKASEYIHKAIAGSDPGIVKKVLAMYDSMPVDELAKAILKKNTQSGRDAIGSAIEVNGKYGANNEGPVSLLLNKVLESNQKLSAEQLLRYTLQAIKTNQPNLVTLLADTIEKNLPEKDKKAIFESIQLSEKTAKQTDLSILKTLQEHGTTHTKAVQGVMLEKENKPKGFRLAIGIMIEKFTDWSNKYKLGKEENMQQVMSNFKSFKERNQEQRQPAPKADVTPEPEYAGPAGP
ncbi:ankyrin repeat-containing protein [Legionella birminghamensis]|uniref:Ankyrin repeat-containing protein n=1 Tax=Legionella birminghamensis TaxID=28083 RepID=A0A378I730_9GAMM|nr:hypothetical protein [Legionella birminghamensis]KTC68269.1 ankyrin repeat-containing protein [Legionella birminghamensis]STX31018.1 ankyrin repeat-containing protein [Legionella birminghamensis]